MRLYLEHDSDPHGGYFCASEFKPDPATMRRTIDEVRVVENFPDPLWKRALAGELPVDLDGSNDSTWAGWWADADPVPHRRAVEDR